MTQLESLTKFMSSIRALNCRPSLTTTKAAANAPSRREFKEPCDAYLERVLRLPVKDAPPAT